MVFFLFIPVNRIWHFMQIVMVNFYHSLDKLNRRQIEDILFFSKIRLLHFMRIVSSNHLHEKSKLIFIE